MKTLNFNGERFEADKIIKTETDIIGKDVDKNEIFAFKGISDFTGFVLDSGQEFDSIKTDYEIIKERLDATESALMALMDMGAM